MHPILITVIAFFTFNNLVTACLHLHGQSYVGDERTVCIDAIDDGETKCSGCWVGDTHGKIIQCQKGYSIEYQYNRPLDPVTGTYHTPHGSFHFEMDLQGDCTPIEDPTCCAHPLTGCHLCTHCVQTADMFC